MSTLSGKQSLGEREGQEDAFRIVRQSEEDPNSDILMLVADGMGGHVGGEIASNLALEEFERHFSTVSQNPKPRLRLKESLLAANAAVAARIKSDTRLAGMGCTLLAVLKLGNRLIWVSVGDSVLFMLRGKRLIRLNADHSLYGELMDMVSQGKLTQAEADANPRRNALRSAVMGETISLIDLNATTLEPGDLILLATDGVETLSDKQIQKILMADPKADMRGLTSDLLNAVEARAKPKQDNSTVVLYRHVTEGHSGLYRDSRWRLPASANGGGWGALRWAIIGGVALVSLALMVWLIARPLQQPEPPQPEAQQPVAVDRSVGRIEGGVQRDTPPEDDTDTPEQGDPITEEQPQDTAPEDGITEPDTGKPADGGDQGGTPGDSDGDVPERDQDQGTGSTSGDAAPDAN